MAAVRVDYRPERITARGGIVDRRDAPFLLSVAYRVPLRLRLTRDDFKALAQSVVQRLSADMEGR